METIVAMIMAGVVIAFVGYPLLRASPEEVAEPFVEEESVEDELAAQKEATYAAISELDFDHAMGNLSNQDHEELRERYKLKALTLIKQIDEVEQAGAAARPPERPAATAEEARGGGGPRTFCSGCGAKPSPDDRFCAGCGKSLGSGCPNCGVAFDPGDAFCAGCGQRL
ncbi:MAG: zinc ribbon domain-containing protein [Chloroflexi bacterium]|nr:zinc ribbon domain-containing protein [Chloroflexota bacterium]